jgi:hypothetical protein
MSFAAQCIYFAGALKKESFYTRWVEEGRNPLRWLEYSVSASVMMFAIAFFAGVTTITELVLMVSLTATTMAFGWMTEEWNIVIARIKRSQGKGPRDLLDRLAPHFVGWFPQIIAWGIVILRFVEAANETEGEMPDFVYGIVFGEIVIFMGFAAVQIRQFWSPPSLEDHVTAEIAYTVLSITAKTVLAWVIFGSVLRS